MMIDHVQLKAIFDRYSYQFYQVHKRFSFEDFGDFATTLLNYQVNTQLISRTEKKEAAYYLAQLYNAGMGNRILEKDLLTIAEVVTNDYSFDLDLLNKILEH